MVLRLPFVFVSVSNPTRGVAVEAHVTGHRAASTEEGDALYIILPAGIDGTIGDVHSACIRPAAAVSMAGSRVITLNETCLRRNRHWWRLICSADEQPGHPG